MKIGIIGIFLSGFAGLAHAGEWADYSKAFPLFPCSDGWTMCSVDGQTVGPGLSVDSQGNPIPSNMRFSFWTLETMPNASPFNALSAYEGELGQQRSRKGEPAAVAEVAPREPERRPDPAPREREVIADRGSASGHSTEARGAASTPSSACTRRRTPAVSANRPRSPRRAFSRAISLDARVRSSRCAARD